LCWIDDFTTLIEKENALKAKGRKMCLLLDGVRLLYHYAPSLHTNENKRETSETAKASTNTKMEKDRFQREEKKDCLYDQK